MACSDASEPILTCPELEKLIGALSAYLCAPSAYLGTPSAYLGVPSAYLGETKIKLTKMEFGLSLTKINNLDKYMISTAHSHEWENWVDSEKL